MMNDDPVIDRSDAQQAVRVERLRAELTELGYAVIRKGSKENYLKGKTTMTEDQIKHMVDRFLSWKLPENFNPDGGVSFKKTFNDHLPTPSRYEPSGTNLLDGTQATAMVCHMIEGAPIAAEFAWLIEAPGLRYLASRTVGSSKEFFWTQDHDRAIRFRSEAECDGVMMAVRQLAPALFGFQETIGDAKAVEHGWG